MGAAAFLILSAVGYTLAPKRTLIATLLVFLLQDALVAITGGRGSLLGGMLQSADEGALVGLLVGVAARALIERRVPRVAKWERWWLAYAAAGLASTAVQHASWSLALVGIFLVSKGFVYAFVVQQLDWEPADARRWIVGLVSVFGLYLVFAIPDFIAPTAFRSLLGFSDVVDIRSGLPSVVSLAGHPGGYGYTMSVAAILALACLVSVGGRKWAGGALGFFLGALLSMRRKTILGLFAACLSMLAFVGRQVNRRVVYTAVAVFLLVLLSVGTLVLPVLVEGARGYVSTDALTNQARTALYAGSALLARDHFPLGVGVGRYGSAGSVSTYSDVYYELGFNLIYGMSPRYSDFITDTFWPQVLGEAGVLGMIGYVGAVTALLRGSIARARRGGSGLQLALFVATPAIAVETLLESVAAPTFGVAFPACLSLGLMALSSARWLDSDVQPTPIEPPTHV